VDHAQIVSWIVGRDLVRGERAATVSRGPVRLQADGLFGAGLIGPLSFRVEPGEVLAITGLVGSGYETVARWLAGLESPAAGSLLLDNRKLPFGRSSVLRARGLQVISGDRANGIFASLSVRENLFPLRRIGCAGTREPEHRLAASIVKRYGVQPQGCAEAPISILSGGNQQKVLFARALEALPRALLMIDPTSGVDIGARAELYSLLKRETARGLAVVLASSDFDEIESQADSAIVMVNGRVGAQLAGAELSQARLVFEALGQAGNKGAIS
jgi:ribose transport system ATP-binding protein